MASSTSFNPRDAHPLRRLTYSVGGLLTLVLGLVASHWPLLSLPYYWDEAGYYVPAAIDFYRHGLLIPQSTLPTGHTPLVIIYLAAAWKVFGFSPPVTRVAMMLAAAGTLAALYKLGRKAAGREIAAWATVLLAVSPLFFAQSSLVQLDLPATLFTILALVFLLGGEPVKFALSASLAALTKETAIVLMPVAWAFAWFRKKDRRLATWCWLGSPLLPLALWTLYYHHSTGFWTGNHEYLEFNLYSTLGFGRLLATLLRRLYQVFVGGFHWVFVAGALAARRWESSTARIGREDSAKSAGVLRADFNFLAIGLLAVYVIFLTFVGGAALPRYLLPAFPVYYLLLVLTIFRLPKPPSRGILLATGVLFVAAWFINPPYPFPFEDNLAYADFIHLHQQAAQFLAAQPRRPLILTAWPATDELIHPDLGYVPRPLRAKGIEDFSSREFRSVAPESFNLLYLYSRRWQPRNNWMMKFPCCRDRIMNVLRYHPPARVSELVTKFHLRLLASFERRGQWVRIYARPLFPDRGGAEPIAATKGDVSRPK